MKLTQQGWFTWGAVSLLAILCGSLAMLQYRWIGELSTAELDQLQKELANRLALFGRNFSDRIEAAESRFMPLRSGSDLLPGSRGAVDPIFSRVGVVETDDESGDKPDRKLNLLILDAASGNLVPSPWPVEWESEPDRLLNEMERGHSHGPGRPELIEIPRFRGGWLLLEVNLNYLKYSLISELITVNQAGVEYDAAVFDNGPGLKLLYESSPGIARRVSASPDAEVNLLQDEPRGRGPGPRAGPRPPQLPPVNVPMNRNPPPGRFAGGPPGRWRLVVRHRAGSLEAVVAHVRARNLAVSAGMLILIVLTAAMLVQLSRRQKQIAALQMNFVTGVSHELRTPLTVIRTAAFNLRGKPGRDSLNVERYGKLIQDESAKLTALVEQVLMFAKADAAPTARARRMVGVNQLIDAGLEASGIAEDITVDKRIAAGLPQLSVDEQAMTQALRNLLDNAIRYGGDSRWIGIAAARRGEMVEIRVADHGPGIPAGEQNQVFEAFFRGKGAIDNQIHGTGLGLNLTRRIVEANSGTIHLESQTRGLTEFIITLPGADVPSADKVSDSVSNSIGSSMSNPAPLTDTIQGAGS